MSDTLFTKAKTGVRGFAVDISSSNIHNHSVVLRVYAFSV